jgi:DNA-binding NarL/FixJ family response regulator
MLRRQGQRRDARAPLRAGLDLARSCGARPLAERAYHELRATGASPRKLIRTGAGTLTASERRVAQMGVSGMSNKQIAQALFVTVKTVESHLAQSYRKLGVSSRTELGSVLSQDRAGA